MTFYVNKNTYPEIIGTKTENNRNSTHIFIGSESTVPIVNFGISVLCKLFDQNSVVIFIELQEIINQIPGS